MADFFEIAAAVYAGAVMAASFLWGMSRLSREDDTGLVYPAIIFPMLFFLATVYLTGQP